jgi:outer membrane immunogenic protein
VHQGRSQAETIANLQEITSQKCQRLLVASLFKFAIRVRVLPFCKENGQMSSLLKRRLLSLLLLLLGSGLAEHAAAQNYEGPILLRFGAFGQGSWDTFKVTDSTPASGTAHADGGAGGIVAGIDYRFANGVLIGAETDLAIGSIGGSFDGTNFDVDLWWTVRGRLGFHVRPDILVYGTAGAAFASVSAHNPNPFIIPTNREEITQPGWTAGGGVEWDLFHSTTLFAEYLHMGFHDWNFAPGIEAFHANLDADVFRVGVKFKVGYDGYDP